MSDPGYLPHDRDAARPEDLARKRTPRPVPALLGTEGPVWPGPDPSALPFLYIGQALSPAEFRQYVAAYDFGSLPPSWPIYHHTWNPDASWAPASTNQSTWWDRNEGGMSVAQKKAKRKPQLDSIMRYYRDSLGWPVGPHLFVDDLFIWLFTPLYEVGIHANEGNSYHRNGVLRYSVGIEIIGEYDTHVWPSHIVDMAGWTVACLQSRLGFSSTYTNAPEDRPDLHDGSLSGHRDYSTKTCPGSAIANEMLVQAARRGAQLYAANTPPGPTPTDPLKAKQLDGPNGTRHYCSVGTFNFYTQQVGTRNGLWDFGYALADEYHTTDSIGQACQIMPFERGVLKTTASEGARPALLSEALKMAWVKP